MKKFLFILILTLFIVSVFAVPCIAVDVTIDSGVYYGTSSISLSNNSSDRVDLPFFYIKNGVRYDCVGMSFYFRDGTEIIGYFDLADGTRLSVYDRAWLDPAFQTIYILNDYQYSPSSNQQSFYTMFSSIFTKISTIDNNQLLITDIFSLFGYVGVWIASAVSSISVIFWADNALTFVGILSVASLAFAVSFLIIGLISRFLRFRG